jgi:hypothetical protein
VTANARVSMWQGEWEDEAMARTYIQNLAPFSIKRRNMTEVMYGGTAVVTPPQVTEAAQAPAAMPAAAGVAGTAVVAVAAAPAWTIAAPAVVTTVAAPSAATADVATAPAAAELTVLPPQMRLAPLARERTAARKRAYDQQYVPCHPELYTGEGMAGIKRVDEYAPQW